MKTRHTPGPWRIARHDTLKDVRHVDAGPTGYERTTVAILSGPRSDANAALIASAPDLSRQLADANDRIAKLESGLANLLSWAESANSVQRGVTYFTGGHDGGWIGGNPRLNPALKSARSLLP